MCDVMVFNIEPTDQTDFADFIATTVDVLKKDPNAKLEYRYLSYGLMDWLNDVFMSGEDVFNDYINHNLEHHFIMKNDTIVPVDTRTIMEFVFDRFAQECGYIDIREMRYDVVMNQNLSKICTALSDKFGFFSFAEDYAKSLAKALNHNNDLFEFIIILYAETSNGLPEKKMDYQLLCNMVMAEKQNKIMISL